MTVKYEKKITVKIGTRGSPLALHQARMVELRLHGVWPGIRTEIIPIKTSGDWQPADGEKRLDENQGGKALFAKEIEEALISRKIDIAVHSMKDMETVLPDELTIPCILPREDPRDAFLSNIAQNTTGLPSGSTVGTASVRRQAFLLSMRPDLKVVPLRGNLDTRIEKLNNGQVDATFLAYAGLKRLGKQGVVRSILEFDEMLPAAGQGAVGIEVRRDNQQVISYLSQINHNEAYMCVACERAVLSALGGTCRTPVGIHARLSGLRVYIRACLISPDGKYVFNDNEVGDLSKPDDIIDFGRNIGSRLRNKAPKEVLSQI